MQNEDMAVSAMSGAAWGAGIGAAGNYLRGGSAINGALLGAALGAVAVAAMSVAISDDISHWFDGWDDEGDQDQPEPSDDHVVPVEPAEAARALAPRQSR